ncbi:hypothetical protein EDD21DRAFT_391559 [Dissophora ornata]|nr:hypothetical protein EDD21DRAFT_391559 [Dissophora ornata]
MAQPNSSQNTQQQKQHSQLPPEYRQALHEQQQRQQQQQTSAPTLQDIEQKYSQLPPQYRQALLEKQQREHQQQQLQQQQQGQQGKNQSPPPPQQQPQQQQQQPQQRYASRLEPSANTTKAGRNQSVSLSSSPSGSGEALSRAPSNAWNSTRQRIVSAPLTGAYRRDRDNDSTSTTSSIAGPGRAHWKPDSSTNVCTWPGCRLEFGLFDRRHHCRKCGDIFCSTHCSKEVPLDQALDFNPTEGMMGRSCVGCFEAYEQWQGLIPSGRNYSSNIFSDAYGSGTGFGTGARHTTSNTNESSSKSMTSQPPSRKPNIGRIPDGFLGGESTSEAFGREDIVRQSSSSPANIAIKRQPPTEPTVMPMPSVPHDWSWSTF